MRIENFKKRTGRFHGIVSCTACGQQVNHFQKGSFYRHPSLSVLICKNCFKYYMSDDISRASDGMDEQCRWCAEGGNLIGCDFCHNAFCKRCVLHNFGRKELSTILDESNQWQCYVCNPEPLLKLVNACDSVFENLEELLQENKKMKAERKNNRKVRARTPKLSPKKYSFNCNGEKAKLDESCSGSASCGDSALTVPEDLLQKTKELIEITSNTNSSYIKFLKQAADNSEMSPALKLQQLVAFKSVLADIKRNQQALDDALNAEIQALDTVHKEKIAKDFKITDVNSKTNTQKGKSCAGENQYFLNLDAQSTINMRERKQFLVEDQNSNGSGEHEESRRKDGPQYEATKTSIDLHIDIASVSPSVPEDIFDSFETAPEIQSSTDYLGDGNSGTEPEQESSSIKLNSPSKDDRKNKSETTAKVTKELYVKLSPMPLFYSPVQGNECQVPQEKDVRKNYAFVPTFEKYGASKENSENKPYSGENKVVLLSEDLHLQRPLKTVSIRQKAEADLPISNSNEESKKIINEKKNLSIRKKGKQTSSLAALDNPISHKVPKAKRARIVDQSSDSDDTQAVLTEVSHVYHCTSDSAINDIQFIHNIRARKDTNEKTEWKSSTSSSDFGIKKGKSAKSSRISERTCPSYSESSHYDLELEGGKKIMSKVGPDRVIKKRVSYKKGCEFLENETQKKIAVGTKMKERVTTEQGISDNLEGTLGQNFSAAGDSVKTCKRGMELRKRSSEAEEKVNFPEGKIIAKTKEKMELLKIKTCKFGKNSSSAAGGQFPKKDQNNESSSYKKQSRKETATKGKETLCTEENTIKREQQHESASDATENFPEGEETGHLQKSNSDTTDEEKKCKRIKGKLSKNEAKLSNRVEKLTEKGYCCGSSEDTVSKNGEPGRKKKKRIFPKRSVRKRPACLSSDSENYFLRAERCDSVTKRRKRMKLKERRNFNPKGSYSSSSDTEKSSEDNKKQEKQRTPAKRKTGNAKEKQGISLRTSTKRIVVDKASSPSDNVVGGQSSVGKGSSDEQKIKPLSKSLVLPSHTRFCQSSREDDAFPRSVLATEDNDDSSDPENSVAKKMLLEEIRVSLFSEEEVSTNDES
ncbi:Transcriptional regulator ATRX [Microtus ochrogaster]|uniref:Transcriptional regulator ATRX n=1 Tax=Microtus ochrogaster TaxID=79684 RepID=A0A8J6KTG1_MICOH|nr:Transcriptional regulator ATRX [Microtus ochrogaster]